MLEPFPELLSDDLTGYALNPARDLGPRLLTSVAGWGSAVYSYRRFKKVFIRFSRWLTFSRFPGSIGYGVPSLHRLLELNSELRSTTCVSTVERIA